MLVCAHCRTHIRSRWHCCSRLSVSLTSSEGRTKGLNLRSWGYSEESPFPGHAHRHTHSHSYTFIDNHLYTPTFTHSQSHPFTHPSVVRGWGRLPSLPYLASLHLLLVPGNVSCSLPRFGQCQGLLLLKHYQQFAWISLNSFLVQPFQLNHSTPVCPSPTVAGHCVRWWAARQLQNKKKRKGQRVVKPTFHRIIKSS